MQMRGALVAAVVQFFALQPVVLDIVDDLQRAGGEQPLQQEKCQADRPEP